MCNTVSNAVSNAFVTPFVTVPPTRPDPTRPLGSYDSIHRHSVKASRADAWMTADAAIGGGR